MPSFGEHIEYLVYKERIHLRTIRKFIDAEKVKSRIIHDLALKGLTISVPVNPQQLVIKHRERCSSRTKTGSACRCGNHSRNP